MTWLSQNINLALELVDQDQPSTESFRSRADILRDEESLRRKNMEEEIANDPLLKEAERIFNTKVDRVVLN